MRFKARERDRRSGTGATDSKRTKEKMAIMKNRSLSPNIARLSQVSRKNTMTGNMTGKHVLHKVSVFLRFKVENLGAKEIKNGVELSLRTCFARFSHTKLADCRKLILNN